MWAAPIAPGATRHCMLPIPPLEDAAGGPSTTKVPPLSSEHRPLELGPGARSKRALGVREEHLLLIQKVRRGVLLLWREVRARR